jgi:hypothetical protein
VTGGDKLGEVEIEEDDFDSFAHLDIIAADGGVLPAPSIGCFSTNGMLPSIDNRNQGLVLYYVKI